MSTLVVSVLLIVYLAFLLHMCVSQCALCWKDIEAKHEWRDVMFFIIFFILGVVIVFEAIGILVNHIL